MRVTVSGLGAWRHNKLVMGYDLMLVLMVISCPGHHVWKNVEMHLPLTLGTIKKGTSLIVKHTRLF